MVSAEDAWLASKAS